MDNQNQQNQDQISHGQQLVAETQPPSEMPSPATVEAPPTAIPPEQPKPRTKNWKKWIISGGIVFVILLTGTAFVLSKQKSQEPDVAKTVKPTVSSPSPTPDPTADWKTYTNTKYGYSIKYPNDWSIVDVHTDENVTFGGKGEGQGEGYKPPLISVTVSDDTNNDPNWQQNYNPLIYREFGKGGKVYRIIAHTYLIGGDATPTVQEVLLEAFNKMVPAFEFIKTTYCKADDYPEGWIKKQFSNSWNMQYPADWKTDEIGLIEGHLSMEGCFKGNKYYMNFGYPLGGFASFDDYVEIHISEVPENQRSSLKVTDITVAGTQAKKVLNLPSYNFADKMPAVNGIRHSVFIWKSENISQREVVIQQISGEPNPGQMEELLDLFVKNMQNP